MQKNSESKPRFILAKSITGKCELCDTPSELFNVTGPAAECEYICEGCIEDEYAHYDDFVHHCGYCNGYILDESSNPQEFCNGGCRARYQVENGQMGFFDWVIQGLCSNPVSMVTVRV